MGDIAKKGNRLTAQGGGRIAGPARRAQNSDINTVRELVMLLVALLKVLKKL
jgi:hypothetical protein